MADEMVIANWQLWSSNHRLLNDQILHEVCLGTDRKICNQILNRFIQVCFTDLTFGKYLNIYSSKLKLENCLEN